MSVSIITDSMDNLIFKYKHARILLALRDKSQSWYIASLAKAAGATYVHTCNFVDSCEKIGFVASEKHGKEKMLKLTEKGSRIADMVAGIYNELPPPVENLEQKAAAQQVSAQQKQGTAAQTR